MGPPEAPPLRVKTGGGGKKCRKPKCDYETWKDQQGRYNSTFSDCEIVPGPRHSFPDETYTCTYVSIYIYVPAAQSIFGRLPTVLAIIMMHQFSFLFEVLGGL